MSIKRWNTKRDSAEPPIIDALERVGFEVWPMDFPCDLAVRKSNWPPGMFQFLEVKTGRGKKGTVSKDRRQAKQQAFIASTGTPIVRTPIEALRAIGAVET